jgi:hypothetical protein
MRSRPVPFARQDIDDQLDNAELIIDEAINRVSFTGLGELYGR